MKTETLVRCKYADAFVQAAATIIAAITAKQTWFFSLYLPGIVQVVSTLLWLTQGRNAGYRLLKGRQILTPVMIVGMLVLLCLLLLLHDGFLQVSIGMLFIGPVIGISYFILTLREAVVYKRRLGTVVVPS